MKRISVFCVLILMGFAPALAQDYRDPLNFSLDVPRPDPQNPGQMIPYIPPTEPNIPPVKYLKQEPPVSLRDRVDRLLQGVKVDIPPEYDHYGYEMRRYMAHIGGPSVYGNMQRIEEELGNIRKAKIVHKYWKQELWKEIRDIEKTIEAENAPVDIRTTFKYNSGVVTAFMTEAQSWMDKNEALLTYLVEKNNYYTFSDPKFVFQDKNDRIEFATHYEAAQKARGYINEYVPYAAMVY